MSGHTRLAHGLTVPKSLLATGQQHSREVGALHYDPHVRLDVRRFVQDRADCLSPVARARFGLFLGQMPSLILHFALVESDGGSCVRNLNMTTDSTDFRIEIRH